MWIRVHNYTLSSDRHAISIPGMHMSMMIVPCPPVLLLVLLYSSWTALHTINSVTVPDKWPMQCRSLEDLRIVMGGGGESSECMHVMSTLQPCRKWHTPHPLQRFMSPCRWLALLRGLAIYNRLPAAAWQYRLTTVIIMYQYFISDVIINQVERRGYEIMMEQIQASAVDASIDQIH